MDPQRAIQVKSSTGWSDAFTFSEADVRRMRGATGGCSDVMTGTFGSVAVIDGPQPVVLVPMGVQGILRFDGQRWERLGVLGLQPVTTWGPPWLQRASILVLLGVMLAAVPMALISQVHERRRRRWIGAAVTSAIAGFVGLVLAVTAVLVASGDSTLFTTIVAAVALCLFAAALASVWLPLQPPPPPLPYPQWPGMS